MRPRFLHSFDSRPLAEVLGKPVEHEIVARGANEADGRAELERRIGPDAAAKCQWLGAGGA